MGLKKHGKHQSTDAALMRSLQRIERLRGVKKVILGISSNCRHAYSPGRLRFMGDVKGGCRFNGYSGNGITRFIVLFTDDITQAEHADICKLG